MSEISGFFYCEKCGKNTSFCGMPKGSKNDHNTRGNNTEWKYKDNKWSFKNKNNGWSDFRDINIQDNIFWCDNCFDEKSSFTDFIKNYPSIIHNHLLDKINQLEKENLKIKLDEKENEIKILKINENNYINKIKKYENEIQTLKNDNNDLINKIKLLENNINNNINNINNNNYPNNDKKIILLMEELKIKENTINDLKDIILKYAFDLKKGESLMPVIFQSIDSKIHYAIICKNTDRFNKIENILYDKYPEYIENENYFTINGIKINKNKTMEKNNIKYSDIIILNNQ